MARKPRIHYPGTLYHVMLRGNGGADIFFAKGDILLFRLSALRLLAKILIPVPRRLLYFPPSKMPFLKARILRNPSTV